VVGLFFFLFGCWESIGKFLLSKYNSFILFFFITFFKKKKKKKKPLFCYTCAGGIGGGVFHGFFFAER